MTIEQAVEMAVEHHRARRVREAEALYRRRWGRKHTMPMRCICWACWRIDGARGKRYWACD
jgi:hypothetical protein